MQHMEAATPNSAQEDPGRQAKTTPANGFEVLFGKTAFSASVQVGSGEVLPAEKPALPVEKPALTPAQPKMPRGAAPWREEEKKKLNHSRMEENLSPVEVLPKAEVPPKRAASTIPITITAPPTLARICKNLGLTPMVAPPMKPLPTPPSSRLAPSELASESRQSWMSKGKTWKASLSELDEGLGRWRDHCPGSTTEAGQLSHEDTGASGQAAGGRVSAFHSLAPEAPTPEASAQVVTDSSFEGKSFVEDRMFAVSGIHLLGGWRAQEAYRLLHSDVDDKNNSASPQQADSLRAESVIEGESGPERKSSGSHASWCSRGASTPVSRSGSDFGTGLANVCVWRMALCSCSC